MLRRWGWQGACWLAIGFVFTMVSVKLAGLMMVIWGVIMFFRVGRMIINDLERNGIL